MGEIKRRKPGSGDAPARVKSRHKTATVSERYMAFVHGDIDVTELDNEEVFRGQLRNAQGDFRGGVPHFVPREFAQAMQKEAARRFSADMQALVPEAIAAVKEVMAKKHPQPGDGARVQAAFKTIERYAGKTPETVQIQAEVSVWERNAGEIITVESEVVKEVTQ